MSRRSKVRLLSLIIVLGLWEYYGRRVNPILFTYPLAIFRAFIDLVLSGELQSYMRDSLLVLLYASILAVLVGVFFGVVMGRYALVEWATDIYVNALYSMPMPRIRSLPQGGIQRTWSMASSACWRKPFFSIEMNHCSVARKMTGFLQRQQCG